MPEKSVSVLLIDLGNTRLKWQLRNASRIAANGVSAYDDGLTENLPDADKVLVASVRERADIKSALEYRYGKRLHWLGETPAQVTLIAHCYSQPSRLGVDRWLAMLGARQHKQGALLVVDAGTALTADLLSAEDRHEGGFIVPGLALLAQALFNSTDRVKSYLDEQGGINTGPGTSTVACVVQGARRQQLSFVHSLLVDFPAHELMITGGDGQWLSTELKLNFYSDLVFDGMDSLCAGSFLPW